MKKVLLISASTLLFAANFVMAQGNGNTSAGGLPALIERVEALEAQLAEVTSNDIADTQYVFTVHSTRFTDAYDPGFTFWANVLRIQHTSVIYTFDADGTGTYQLTECNNAGIYSNFDNNNSWINFIPALCGPDELLLSWEQDDNLVFIALENGLEFEGVISNDGSIMSATNVTGGITNDGLFDSHALVGQTGIKVD